MKLSTHSTSDVILHVGILLSAGLILFFGFFFWYLPWSTNHGETIAVPNLSGMSLEKAISTLESKNLDYEVSDSTFISGKSPGTVYSHYPKSQAYVKSGRKVYLTLISYQAPEVSLPNVEGRSVESAKNLLLSVGLELGPLEYVPALEEKTVLQVKLNGQPLRIGDRVKKGSSIVLVVGDGLGNQRLEVPSLLGLPVDEAGMLLSGMSVPMNIQPNELGEVPSSGVVVRQRPEPGTKIRVGDVVDIWVNPN